MITQDGINLLREPASWSRGARHPRVLNVHSGACTLGFHNAWLARYDFCRLAYSSNRDV